MEARATPLSEQLDRWATERPDVEALLAPDRPAMSFHDLRTQIEAIATGLREFGIGQGDVVSICMPDGPELLTAILGAMQTVAVAPFDWKLKEAELRSRLAQIPSRCLWTVAGSPAAAAGSALGIPLIAPQLLAKGVTFTVPDGIAPDTSRFPNKCAVPGETALILQTSATTGVPKLVPLTCANVEAILDNTRRGLPFSSQDRYLGLMPLHHVLGFACAAAQLATGGSVVATSGFDADRLLSWIDEFHPTWYAAGPTLQRAILNY